MISKILNWISRIVFGGVFIFAGFTKAIDPLGSAYKFEDYFLAFGLENFFLLALPLAIVLNTLELLVGLTILLGLKMRISAWIALLFMAFFTPLTFYIALTDPVPDCGCFGDAIIISNWDTFYKNIFVFAAAVVLFLNRKKFKPLWTETKDWYLVGVLLVLILWLSFYCMKNLPVIDFRPWKTGNDISMLLAPQQEEEIEYTFIYENKLSAEKEAFALDELPTTDTNWVFVERKKTIIQPYIASPIENFYILDEFENDLTYDVINIPEYHFLIIAHDLNTANKGAFKAKLNPLADEALNMNFPVHLLTSATYENIKRFADAHEANYPIYQSDERELKTIIRANPGLLLMKNGKVIEKWHYSNIPVFSKIKANYIWNRSTGDD